jgi:ribosomal protein S18 acetylase RimI-like enzyme
MSGTLRIRRATTDDVDVVLRVWRDSEAVASTTDDPSALRTLIARDRDALLLADIDGTSVGTLIVGWDGWRANLYRLAVVPAWRRRGIARSLVKVAEERVRSLGARRAAAVVVSQHAHASAFWRAVGYELDGRVGRFAKML